LLLFAFVVTIYAAVVGIRDVVGVVVGYTFVVAIVVVGMIIVTGVSVIVVGFVFGVDVVVFGCGVGGYCFRYL